MEKKIRKKFLQRTIISVVLCALFSQGSYLHFFILLGVLVLIVLNQVLLVKIITQLTAPDGMVRSESQTKSTNSKLMIQLFIKLTLLVVIMGAIYNLDQTMVIKALGLIIFQLIIFVLSIKNY
jgi:hypothetical protein